MVLPARRKDGTRNPSRFDGFVDGEKVVSASLSPLYDGARALLAMGRDGEALLTMRHESKGFDSFLPRPVDYWAGYVVHESDRDGIYLSQYRPRPHSTPQEERAAA